VRAATGAGAPTKIDHSVRTGGVDYLSSDVTLSGAFTTTMVLWDSNPGTSQPWTQADLSAAGYNLGFKSIT